MEWLKVYRSLYTHRKINRLATLLGLRDTDVACIKLIRLWDWCLDNAPDGDLSELTPKEIANAANWKRNCNDFVAKLVQVGFLDAEQNTLTLHNWGSRAGKDLGTKSDRAGYMRDYRQVKRDSYVTTREQSRNTTEKRREEKSTKEVPPISPKGDFTDADFEAFWTAYDHRNGSKAEAKKRWVKILNAGVVTKEQLLVSVQNYKADCVASNRFQQDASTFLGDTKQTYMNYLEPVEPAKKAGGNGQTPDVGESTAAYNELMAKKKPQEPTLC